MTYDRNKKNFIAHIIIFSYAIFSVFFVYNLGFAVSDPSSSINVYLSSSQTISNASWMIVNFNAENYDLGNEYSTSTYRFQPVADGYYRLSAHTTIDYSGSSSAERVRFLKNGTTALCEADDMGTGYSDPHTINTQCNLYLLTTDYIQVQYFGYNSGGFRKLGNTNGDTWLSINRLEGTGTSSESSTSTTQVLMPNLDTYIPYIFQGIITLSTAFAVAWIISKIGNVI